MMNKKGILFIISGASATGKDTVIAKVLEQHGEEAKLSISMTTRNPRPGERDGIDYFFVDIDGFERRISENRLLEYAKYGPNYYGTPVGPVKNWLNEGKIVFLIIEVQGAAQVRERFPEARSIFVLPPSMAVLEERLRKRGTEDEEAIQCRLAIAHDEIKRASEYDYIIINDELDVAVENVLSICNYELEKSNNMELTDCSAEQFKKDNMIKLVSEVIDNA